MASKLHNGCLVILVVEGQWENQPKWRNDYKGSKEWKYSSPAPVWDATFPKFLNKQVYWKFACNKELAPMLKMSFKLKYDIIFGGYPDLDLLEN